MYCLISLHVITSVGSTDTPINDDDADGDSDHSLSSAMLALISNAFFSKLLTALTNDLFIVTSTDDVHNINTITINGFPYWW